MADALMIYKLASRGLEIRRTDGRKICKLLCRVLVLRFREDSGYG